MHHSWSNLLRSFWDISYKRVVDLQIDNVEGSAEKRKFKRLVLNKVADYNSLENVVDEVNIDYLASYWTTVKNFIGDFMSEWGQEQSPYAWYAERDLGNLVSSCAHFMRLELSLTVSSDPNDLIAKLNQLDRLSDLQREIVEDIQYLGQQVDGLGDILGDVLNA
jgi:hypothetical protein